MERIDESAGMKQIGHETDHKQNPRVADATRGSVAIEGLHFNSDRLDRAELFVGEV